MPELTPQERMALVVVAVLIATGAVGRHLDSRAAARRWLEYTANAADTLNPASNPALRERVEREIELERVRTTPLGPGERIDPNTAPPEQLDRLPRVGAALAERIVAHREAVGGFRTPEDLLEVAGIGPALLEGIRPHLDLRAAPVASRAPGRAGSVGARGPPGDRVDVNRATAEELQRIRGIGPAIAERIVADRAANGRYRTWSDLERVSGIGPALRARIEREARLGSR